MKRDSDDLSDLTRTPAHMTVRCDVPCFVWTAVVGCKLIRRSDSAVWDDIPWTVQQGNVAI